MSQNQFSKSKAIEKSVSIPYGWIALAVISVSILLVGAIMLASPLSPAIRNLANWLFALESAQSTWFITRSAGMIAYLLLWLSTIWGLAISSKIIDRLLHRSFTFDFHQVLSLLALGFLGLHVFILMADQYLPYSLSQILVPFLSPYRPFWVGIGVLAFYISILVSVTFYMRQKIGMKTFRLIHYTSLIGYLGATLHGIFAGTDSSLPAAMLMYIGTFLVVIFLVVYWLLMIWLSKRPQSTGVKMQMTRN
jgi:methionine sulfoxide reductase heme-binding subunit